MIRYTLHCDDDHEFEGWFGSSADFDSQMASGYISCPVCHSLTVTKTLMAPNVTTGHQKDAINALVMDTTRREMLDKLKQAVGEIRKNAEDVGEKFPEEARKIHYGETEARGIIGQASPDEAEALIEEGIGIAALPVFPDDAN
mgnify:CR=1 FL=1